MKIWTQLVIKVAENNERRNTLAALLCVLSDAYKRFQAQGMLLFGGRNYRFLKKYVSSEGADSHNVLYYQQLSNARYQVSFYGNNYFEELPKVSSAFNTWG